MEQIFDFNFRELLVARPLFVDIVFWLGIALFIGTALLVAYVILLKLLRLRKEVLMRKTKARWQPLFRQKSINLESEIPKIYYYEKYFLLEIWLEERMHCQTEDYGYLDKLAEALQLDRTIENILRKDSTYRFTERVWLQIIAIHAASLIDSELSRSSLYQAVKSANMSVSVAACTALIKIDPEKSARLVISTLFRFPKWTPMIMLQLSKAGGGNALHMIEPVFNELPAYTKRNFISLVELSKDESLLPLLIARLEISDDVQEKAAILKALGRLGSYADRHRILAFLSHENWILRVHAATALGSIGVPEDAELLIPLLSDQEWWVRYRAAIAYVQLTQDDTQQIGDLMEMQVDKYAKDILYHAAVERSWCLT